MGKYSTTKFYERQFYKIINFKIKVNWYRNKNTALVSFLHENSAATLQHFLKNYITFLMNTQVSLILRRKLSIITTSINNMFKQENVINSYHRTLDYLFMYNCDPAMPLFLIYRVFFSSPPLTFSINTSIFNFFSF